MAFTLPPLPYAYDALEPAIDKETMTFHHDKHHQTYVDNLNKAVGADSSLQGKSIEDLLAKAQARDAEAAAEAVGKSFAGDADPYRKPRTSDEDE